MTTPSLESIGGEPLNGSGFEDEEPIASSETPVIPDTAPRARRPAPVETPRSPAV